MVLDKFGLTAKSSVEIQELMRSLIDKDLSKAAEILGDYVRSNDIRIVSSLTAAIETVFKPISYIEEDVGRGLRDNFIAEKLFRILLSAPEPVCELRSLVRYRLMALSQGFAHNCGVIAALAAIYSGSLSGSFNGYPLYNTFAGYEERFGFSSIFVRYWGDLTRKVRFNLPGSATLSDVGSFGKNAMTRRLVER